MCAHVCACVCMVVFTVHYKYVEVVVDRTGVMLLQLLADSKMIAHHCMHVMLTF